ncbi:hypothetical protein [Chryseobacterium indoltheticum]|uniref:hypothetical protein n=1 Tax=Chryseobacterium indoltheticum TaxID=254 RepID=UPI003F4943CA
MISTSAQEFNGLTQNRFIFSFLNKWNNKSTLNYRINYLDEQDSYKGTKNDLDFGWIKGKFNTKGNLSYLNTNATLQDTKFIRGGAGTEYTGKKEVGQLVEVWNTTKRNTTTLN